MVRIIKHRKWGKIQSRKPERIPLVLGRIRDVWEQQPTLRLGQLLEQVAKKSKLSKLEEVELVIELNASLPRRLCHHHRSPSAQEDIPVELESCYCRAHWSCPDCGHKESSGPCLCWTLFG